MSTGLFSKINPMFKGEVILTAAEFSLYFEGSDLQKRFIESPNEIDLKKRIAIRNKKFPMSQELPSSAL